ncbi:cell division protein FtsA [Oceanithermus desulfurans]|uniref:Cell division protein FtsA n=2 Tax=Oceanithermus desulfurans TaxID=227924 RepID=A0A511RLI0_9DEIN|nr:cell division protein FtsA [Oceanithermus desulfurans]MBB6029005.1 cell division protein FtsA [Oceanithermus desulfurans]GEM90524.1 cell division protein FtsA [Oceanithermus desulfurans NBRC 100063]
MSDRIIVGLDVGTTKVCTVIGEQSEDGILDIIGEGTVPSQGMKRGAVVNLDKTTEAIRASVKLAERVAGVPVERVFVGIAGPHIKSVTSHGLAAIRRGHSIGPADVERAVEQAKAYPFDGDYELIHALPLEYRVDGQEGIKDPLGMAGVRLEVDVHLVAAATGPLTNLRRAVEAAGLEIEGLVLQSYASGLAVLTPEDHESTVMLVDIGGSTTDVAVFQNGQLAHSSVIPLGGEQVTGDIAQLLKIPLEEAERIKKKYGAALVEMADPDLMLEINQDGNHVRDVPAPELAHYIRPRVREILLLARGAVDEQLGPLELTVHKVVLTGGSALLRGVEELAYQEFHLPVRLGRPEGLSGLADVVASPAHATAVGLVHFGSKSEPASVPARRTRREPARSEREREGKDAGIWEKIKGIFENFF